MPDSDYFDEKRITARITKRFERRRDFLMNIVASIVALVVVLGLAAGGVLQDNTANVIAAGVALIALASVPLHYVNMLYDERTEQAIDAELRRQRGSQDLRLQALVDTAVERRLREYGVLDKLKREDLNTRLSADGELPLDAPFYYDDDTAEDRRYG